MIEYKKQRNCKRNGEEIKKLEKGYDVIEKVVDKV